MDLVIFAVTSSGDAGVLEAVPMSFVFSHWVSAERTGIISAPIASRMEPPATTAFIISHGVFVIFSPRKFETWDKFIFSSVISPVKPENSDILSNLVQSESLNR